MTLRQLLRTKRIERGFTQKQVSDVLGISPQYVSDVECGRKSISHWRLVFGWATFVGVGIAQLMSVEDR